MNSGAGQCLRHSDERHIYHRQAYELTPSRAESIPQVIPALAGPCAKHTIMAVNQRRYSTEDVATALAYVDTAPSILAAAEDLNIPHRTLAAWSNGELQTMPDSATVAIAREDLAVRLEKLAHLACDRAAQAMPSASAAQAAVVMGVSIEKMRLLRDQSTSNLASNLTESEATDRAASILAKAAKKLQRDREQAIDATFTDPPAITE